MHGEPKRWVIDFQKKDLFEAQGYRAPFEHVREHVMPHVAGLAEEERTKSNKTTGQDQGWQKTWWQLFWCRRELIDRKETARRIRTICPDNEIARDVLDFFSTPPKDSLPSADQLFEEKARIDRSKRVLRSWALAGRHIEILASYANAGDADAIKNLVKVGEHAVQLLLLAKLTHPEIVRTISRSQALWPLLVSAKSSWERTAARQLKGLELGKELEVLQVRFESARGPDQNYPARQWAKAAVRTLEETRRRLIMYKEYREEFEQLIWGGKAEPPEIPRWTGATCRLPLLSKETAPAWGSVIREMIRQQIPNFHTRPEWENQRKTAAHGGRNTAGEIRNAILDDIVSALKRIAPRETLPKSAS